jgi:hypothetical protein
MESIAAQPLGPGVESWLGALVRAFHPFRWLLCLAGLVVTTALWIGLQAVLGMAGGEFLGWWEDPINQASAVWLHFQTVSLVRMLGSLLVVTAIASWWCLLGGWIARHELLARRRHEPGMVSASEGREASAMTLLIHKGKPLLACCPSILGAFLILTLPVVVVILCSGWVGDVGALGMALLLPVVLLIDLFVLAFGIGAVAWPLMSIAIAAEWGDSYDALGRAYSYCVQRPLRFSLLTAVALVLSWLPFGVISSRFPEDLLSNLPALRVLVFYSVASLTVSIFWSLETIVYLHLRTSVDKTDATELATGSLSQTKTPRPAPESSTAAKAPLSLAGLLNRLLVNLVALAGSWCVTLYLFTRVSQGPTDWLDGGLTGWTSVPAADHSGLYSAAGFVARLWLVLSVVFAVVLAVRSFSRSRMQEQVRQSRVTAFLQQHGEPAANESETCESLVRLLGHDRLRVRFQALLHLERLRPEGRQFNYHALAPIKDRNAAIAKWRALVARESAPPEEAESATPTNTRVVPGA